MTQGIFHRGLRRRHVLGIGGLLALPPSYGAGAGITAPNPVTGTEESHAYRVRLDLRTPFTSGTGGTWQVFPSGPGSETFGRPITSPQGLRVLAGGTDPVTGEPAFVYTTGREDHGGDGLADHIKWFALANRTATTGYLGFDAFPGHVLTYEATLSARTYGTGRHPFGAAVQDPSDDLRLAAGAMNTADPETNMVFDFFLTNRRLYAFYERLPSPGQDHVAFSYAVPVAGRSPDQRHRLAISLDSSRGVVTWTADGRQVLRVNRIGLRPRDRQNLILDLGGTEEIVAPRQLACGMGMFTLLDARRPGSAGPALVRLSNGVTYYDPAYGEPRPQRFVDDESLPGNRLWGQGGEVTVTRFEVSSTPATP
jgi:hypothetical protein